MKHHLDDNTELNNPDGTPYSDEQRWGFFIGLEEWKRDQYKRDRATTYSSIGDQLGMLYDDILNGKFGDNAKTGQWFLAVKAVKDNFPKT